MTLKFIQLIKAILVNLYITNPILNPTVLRIQPIRKVDDLGKKITIFRVSRRRHAFDTWKDLGGFETFAEAMEAKL
jgi:hypothetical protein